MLSRLCADQDTARRIGRRWRVGLGSAGFLLSSNLVRLPFIFHAFGLDCILAETLRDSLSTGRKGFLDESDLWKLSPVNLSRVLFPRYDAMSNLSTFRRVLKSNGFDFLVDFVLAHVQTVLV